MKGQLLFLVSMFGFVACKNTYIATVPKSIRPGDDLHLCIASLLGRRGSIDVQARLLDRTNKTVAVTNARKYLQKQPTVITLRVPLTVKPNDYGFTLRVRCSGVINFEKNVINIRSLSKSSSIFIQTDKAAYKPGDLVQFRVFGTDPDLNVLNSEMDIWIQDPKNNRVQQFLKVKPMFGVFGGSFQLSTLTNLGKWNINVKQGAEEKSKAFSVEKFVLPKFEVNVITPSFQLSTSEFFVVDISARYTFGKPVEGKVILTIGRTWTKDNEIVKSFKITGKTTVRVAMSEIYPRIGSYIKVTAVVVERLTGNSANDTQTVQLYQSPEKLSFSQSMSRNFKPGLDYNIVLRATKRDDSPLDPPLGRVNITVTYNVKVANQDAQDTNTQEMPIGQRSSTRTVSKTLWSRNFQISPNGEILTSAKFPSEAVSGNLRATYLKASAYHYVSQSHSPSNNFLQVTVFNNRKAIPGRNLLLKIQTTERRPYVYYKVFAKSVLVSQGRFRLRNRREIPLRITYDMAPNAKLLVYYARRKGEIVADAISFPVDEIFRNKVSLSFNARRVLPATNVQLSVRADPRSLINVLAVDKSVLLYKTGNDVTIEDVVREIQQFDNTGYFPIWRSWDFWFPRPFSGSDAYAVFSQAGVYVLTDADLYQYVEPCEPVRRPGIPGPVFAQAAIGQPGPASSADSGPVGGGPSSLATPSRTRKVFPETWIWANSTVGRNGLAVFKSRAPDTITEWVASAFAVNPRSGLGVASEFANITTFQRFFMRFELPYSAIRGEVIIIQASVFNYLDQDVEVFVTLASDTTFNFVDNNENPFNPGPNGWTKRINVKKGGVGAAYFPIEPRKIGTIKLKGTARTTQAADAVEREFLIEAEGVQQNFNVPLLVDLRQTRTFNAQIEISFPPNIVQDSEFIKVNVIGDLMGPTLTNIENLLRMSYGCGEQNLVGFVPNVYVTTYLQATNRLTPALKDKAEEILRHGYQRQLSYSRNDGSYSAFGDRDKSGSTWLTAFVVKSFAQAADYTFIDINVMSRAIRWLMKYQTTSGAFKEPGRVLHKAMQGGSTSSERSLCAFVLIALVEAKKNNQVAPDISKEVNDAIRKAMEFVADGAPASLDNLYELAIAYYALTLEGHPTASSLFRELELKAKTNGGEKYWEVSHKEAEKIQPWKSWRPPRTKARAIDVEMTSYVLLAYNIRKDVFNGLQVLRWLGKQRNPYGGFISTQDTVVALQALSGLGVQLYTPNFSITLNAKGNGWTGKTFTINNANALVLQSEDVPKTVRNFDIQASGSGLCLFEVAAYFNVIKELRQPAYKLAPTVVRDSIFGLRLKVCFSWTRTQKSSMSLLEINIPSGMEADLDTLDTSQTNGLFKKVEQKFRRIELYFDEVLSTTMCIEIDIRRVALVARHKPVPIKLFDYYEPSNEVIETYQSKALADATIIEVCGAGNCVEVKK